MRYGTFCVGQLRSLLLVPSNRVIRADWGFSVEALRLVFVFLAAPQNSVWKLLDAGVEH